jgi:hypothetical protein
MTNSAVILVVVLASVLFICVRVYIVGDDDGFLFALCGLNFLVLYS